MSIFVLIVKVYHGQTTDSIQGTKLETFVYIPGVFGIAHCLPNETIPT